MQNAVTGNVFKGAYGLLCSCVTKMGIFFRVLFEFLSTQAAISE